jgi:hypothetical protein
LSTTELGKAMHVSFSEVGVSTIKVKQLSNEQKTAFGMWKL